MAEGSENTGNRSHVQNNVMKRFFGLEKMALSINWHAELLDYAHKLSLKDRECYCYRLSDANGGWTICTVARHI